MMRQPTATEIENLLAAGPMTTLAMRKAFGIPAGDAARALSGELARMKRAGRVGLVADRTWSLIPHG
jgi:hypothetical protein